MAVPDWLDSPYAPPLPAVPSALAPSPYVPPALATAPPPGQSAAATPPPGPGGLYGMGPALGAGGAAVDMGPAFDNALYDSYKASLAMGRGFFGGMPSPGAAASGGGETHTMPDGSQMAGPPMGGGAGAPPTTPDAALPGAAALPPTPAGPFGAAPSMPGMLGIGLPDPGAEAMQREEAFASMFPRALEAMNRTGLWRGGSDTMGRPTMPPPKAATPTRPY